MVARTALKTFMHISDLHFAEIDARTGNATLSKTAATLVQTVNWLDGLLGHHALALKELEAFFAHQSLDGPIQVLVTGDFTRCGGPLEITFVKRFLVSRVDLNPPKGNHVGLNLGAMPDASITGNHDQWGGQNFPVGGGPLAAQALVPKTLPYVISQPLPNGRRLLLAGIDTDADVSPRGLWRLFALGSFQSQLVALEQMLPPWKEDDIRVLLAHHSLARTGLALRMDDASKAALKVFLADLQFSVLLTGHTHERLFTNSSVSGRGRARTVQELTCGTTTQHDQVPYGWRSAFGRFPQRNWPPNMLLMHQLFAKPDGGTGWEARPYVRIQGGFKALPSISFDV